MGLEPTTFCMASRRSSQLSYIRVGGQYSGGLRFTLSARGTPGGMPSITVQPRETPGERAGTPVEVELDEGLAVHANELEEWATLMEHWELAFRQGHEFDRANNVEVRLLFTGPGHTCSVSFRLDQLDSVETFDRELWLTLDERDGLARAVRLAPTGLDVELFHVVGSPPGRTIA